MATYKKFYGKKLSIKFFPDAGEQGEPIIYIEPHKGLHKDDLRATKEKIETILNVQSSEFNKQNGKPIFTIKLDKETNPGNVEELLRSMFHGGSEKSNALDLNDENPDPVPDADQVMPAQAQDQMQIQPESWGLFDVFNMLIESTYRTGKYWDTLEKAIGRSKNAIDENNILTSRRIYSRKPKGKRRDEVLRALDKGMRYFVRKIRREQTPEAAQQYKEKYRSIGSLVPTDYKENGHSEPDEDQSSPFYQGGEAQPQEDPVQSAVKISDLFGSEDDEPEDEEEAYEKFEIEE